MIPNGMEFVLLDPKPLTSRVKGKQYFVKFSTWKVFGCFTMIDNDMDNPNTKANVIDISKDISYIIAKLLLSQLYNKSRKLNSALPNCFDLRPLLYQPDAVQAIAMSI